MLAGLAKSHLQLGNEERVDDAYYARFEAMARAIWAKDPDIILVVGDFLYAQPIADPERIGGAASGVTNLSAHQRILALAKASDREVWFDVHLGTEAWNADDREVFADRRVRQALGPA